MRSDLFVLEYSPTQKSFHIESFREMIDDNISVFHSGKLTDFLPLAVSPDREKLDRVAAKLKDLRDRRREEVTNGR